jgi:hypothetical protein
MQQHLKAAEKIFSDIETLINSRRFEAIYAYIEAAEPPSEWILELPSKIGKDTYKTIKLDIMESVMKRIFGHCYIASISSPIINQDKSGRYSVTTVVEYCYMGFDNEYKRLPGIATVLADNLSMLELASPKASSMALKNAIKQLGGLFGKYLNKTDEAEVELPTEKKATPEEQVTSILEGVIAANTLSDLKSWRTLVYSKTSTSEVQALYETKLRQLSNKTTQLS